MLRTSMLVVAALALSACEPTFVEVTYEGAPKCESRRLAQDVMVKIDGPRVSATFRVTGDGAPLAGKLEEGKLYKVKAYRCSSEPCDSEANFFHGEDLTAPKGKTGTVTLKLPGAPACAPVPAPADAPAAPAAAAADAG